MATIGRLTIQKGHRYLFEALSLFPKHISWQLHVYGDGELRNDLHVLAVRYGIDTHVVFHGVVSDVSQVLRSISIIVQPSLWEGLSLVVMEAMAAGRSIVTTDAGGSGIVIDGESGFVVPSRDAQTLVSALTMACTDVSRSVQYAHAAKTFALQALDIEGNMEKVIQVYRVI
jgi:glycosyltransferase involved in cell wall biosynthesis